MYGNQDREPDDGDTDGKDGVSESVTRLVGEVGEDHGECKGGGPWRNAVQLCLDLSIAVAVDD